MKITRLLCVVLAAAALGGCGNDDYNGGSAEENKSFAYTGDVGPAYWAELDPENNGACLSDTSQSPVDVTGAVPDASLTALSLELRDTAIHMINNGHTLELEYHEGSSMGLNGNTYDLLQFHFHTLSEHAVSGQRGAMELHAVFKDAASGNLAVIGMLYNIGEENSFLEHLVDHLPPEPGESVEIENEVNLLDGLTDTSQYFRYSGSLTTPPCSPIVTWTVLKQPATMSESQFQAFQTIMGNNFRPLQKLNDRQISMTP